MVAIGNWLFENCSTVGQGDLVLIGPLESFAEFKTQIPAGEVYYSVQEAGNRELGIGTFDGDKTIQRTQVIATLFNGVYLDNNPNPILLTGQSLVACTIDANAFQPIFDHLIDFNNPHLTTADQIPYDPTDDPITVATDLQAALEDHADRIEKDVTTATGVHQGGIISALVGTDTFDVASGDGLIVDSQTDTLASSITEVVWTAKTGVTLLTPTSTIGVMHIFINSLGDVIQYEGQPPNSYYRDYIKLGLIYFLNDVIAEVRNSPQMVRQSAFDVYDSIRHQEMIQGLDINPVDASLTVWIAAGTIFNPGINWYVDKKDPNVLALAQIGDNVTPAGLFTMYMDGNYSGPSVANIPKAYNSTGVSTVTLTGNKATIHRLYTFGTQASSRTFVLLMGQNEYNDIDRAIGSINYDEAHTSFPDETNGMVFLGYIGVSAAATEFGDLAFIINVVGSKGGGNTNTITQDHNTLFNRDLPNQHPISAIGTSSGDQLTDIIAALEAADTTLDDGKVDKINPSVDNAIVTSDGTTGDQQNSSATISDAGLLTTLAILVTTLTVSGSVSGNLDVAGTIDADYNLNVVAPTNIGAVAAVYDTTVGGMSITVGSSGVTQLVQLAPTGAAEKVWIQFNRDAGVDLYYNNSRKFQTILNGILVTGKALSSQNSAASFTDNEEYVTVRYVTSALSNYVPLTGSSTDNAIARFNGIDGAIQDSDVIIDDSNNITCPGEIFADVPVTGLARIGVANNNHGIGLRVTESVVSIACISASNTFNHYMLYSDDGGLSSKLMYSNSARLTTTAAGVSITGTTYSSGAITTAGSFSCITGCTVSATSGDSFVKAYSGNGGIAIYALNNGNGAIYQLNSGGGAEEPWIYLYRNAGVELRYNNVPKVGTTSGGMNVVGGITFSGSTGTLDYADDGTLSPAPYIAGDTVAGSLTYTVQQGTWVRVGDIVNVNLVIITSAAATVPTGLLRIYNALPFLPSGDYAPGHVTSNGFSNGCDVALVTGSTQLHLYTRDASGNSIIAATSTGIITIRVAATYRTA